MRACRLCICGRALLRKQRKRFARDAPAASERTWKRQPWGHSHIVQRGKTFVVDRLLRENAALREEQDERGSLPAMKPPIADFARSHAHAFDVAVIGMALVAPDASLLRVNASFCALLGYTREELLALPPGALVHPDHRQQDGGRWARSLQDGTSVRGPLPCLNRDGQCVTLDATWALVPGDRGQPSHLLLQIQPPAPAAQPKPASPPTDEAAAGTGSARARRPNCWTARAKPSWCTALTRGSGTGTGARSTCSASALSRRSAGPSLR